jgi:membrane fusion protein, multidrug efflux system
MSQERILAPPPLSVRRRRWPLFLAVTAILVGSYGGWHYFAKARTADAAVDARASAGKAGGPAPIPVTVAQVQKADFPVYLNGLGTVQPFRTVTVRSRVDGQIIKVAFKQGRMVKEGDTLVEIDPRPYQSALDQALSKKAQDEANLKNAKLNLERSVSLAKKDYATQQQVDTQQAMVDQLTAQIQGDQAAIDNAQTQLSYTVIKSPLSGRAGFRLVDPGNIVHDSDQNGIVTIVQLQPISVVFTAPEENVPQINKALEEGTAVPVEALSSDGLRTLAKGQLARVNNEVDQASGTIRMKAIFENRDNVLWPGLSVATRLLVDTLKDATVVPDSAVQRGPNGLYTFVVGDDHKVSLQPIKVSQSGDGESVVEQGLTPGQRVVVAGQYRLQIGSVVQATDAPPSSTQGKEAENSTPKVPSP